MEKWTKLNFDFILFDSKYHDYKKETSEFNKKVKNHFDLLFLVHTEDAITIGGFFPNPKSDFNTCVKPFVFTFLNDKPNKFELKEPDDLKIFQSYSDCLSGLFSLGNHDIIICKENCGSTIYQDDKSSFDYRGIDNALIGRSGSYCFFAKRIIVLQMKQNNDNK